MPRNQVIIKYPTLNDKGGDLSKKWYIEYYYRVPGEKQPRKRRISTGLCNGDAKKRYAQAKKLTKKIIQMLKSPDLLKKREDDITKVLQDDLHTRPEADRYNSYANSIKIENLIKEYTELFRGAVAQKTFETYKSKLKIFANWLNENKKECVGVMQTDMVIFCRWLQDCKNLSKRTITKYKQILRMFYDYLIKQKYISENPVFDIPNYGNLKDYSPAPIEKDDRQKLKQAIENKDPYLWLACEIQYYCAIRPGQELRLLKVGDIDIKNLSITITAQNAKNKHKTVIPITQHIANIIIKMGIMNYSPDLYVFGRYNIPSAVPMGKNTMRTRFNKFRDDLGINKKIKFYSWKHTGAISMVNNGVSVWELQHHMRHSSITTTEEYIKQRAPQSREAKKYIDTI